MLKTKAWASDVPVALLWFIWILRVTVRKGHQLCCSPVQSFSWLSWVNKNIGYGGGPLAPVPCPRTTGITGGWLQLPHCACSGSTLLTGAEPVGGHCHATMVGQLSSSSKWQAGCRQERTWQLRKKMAEDSRCWRWKVLAQWDSGWNVCLITDYSGSVRKMGRL